MSDAPDGKLVCVTGMTPTKAGEGKTTTLVGLTQGLGVIGKRPVACLREPSLGPGVRHQGRRRRRRHDPGRPDGGPQPALHRRHPRHRRGQQPARGDARRLDPARQPAAHRRAARRLAARDGHERPRAAPDRRRARRPRQRLPARDRLRHHRRLRGDGDHGRLRATCRTCAGASAPSPSRSPSTAAPRHRRGARRRRRHGRAAQGRAEAEPDPDARGPAVPDALRPVREHRPRQQLARRRPRSA